MCRRARNDGANEARFPQAFSYYVQWFKTTILWRLIHTTIICKLYLEMIFTLSQNDWCVYTWTKEIYAIIQTSGTHSVAETITLNV